MRKFFALSGFSTKDWSNFSRETASVLQAQMYANAMVKKTFDLYLGEVCWLNRQTFICQFDLDREHRRYFRIIGTALIKGTEYDIEVFIRLVQEKELARQWVPLYNTDVQVDYKPKGSPMSRHNSGYEPVSRIEHLVRCH